VGCAKCGLLGWLGVRYTAARMLNLRQIVELYATLAERFGEAVPLQKFGFGKEETEMLFSGLDEDYHISRFLQFSSADGVSYQINGEAVTHIALDPAIRSLL
jgi:hypothetical protein